MTKPNLHHLTTGTFNYVVKDPDCIGLNRQFWIKDPGGRCHSLVSSNFMRCLSGVARKWTTNAVVVTSGLAAVFCATQPDYRIDRVLSTTLLFYPEERKVAPRIRLTDSQARYQRLPRGEQPDPAQNSNIVTDRMAGRGACAPLHHLQWLGFGAVSLGSGPQFKHLDCSRSTEISSVAGFGL